MAFELLYKKYLTEKYIVFFKATDDSIGLKVVVYGKDREDLFADILGYFQYRGFGVLDAKLNTTNHGYVLDTFLIDQSVMLNEDILRVQKACEYELVQVLNNEREISVPEHTNKLSRRQKNFPLTPRIELTPDERKNLHFIYYLHRYSRAALQSSKYFSFSQNINTLCKNLNSWRKS